MTISKEILDELLQGVERPEDLLGDAGLMKELKIKLMERMLGAELTAHLGYEEGKDAPPGQSNRRNGTSAKVLKGQDGELPLAIPRDRDSSFEPELVKKGQTRIDGIDDKIVGLYAAGLTVRDIQAHLLDLYGLKVSPDLISRVTDAVLDEVREWQSRALERMYPIVIFDALRVKIRDADSRTVKNKAVYVALGVSRDGQREVLGLWIAENEGAKFWLSVMNELKNRGVQDILIAVVDGLKGFPEAITAAFPEAMVQTCIVHLVRHSLNFCSWKDRKAVAGDLRRIYSAPTADMAEAELDAFEEKWAGKYASIAPAWRRAWAEVIPFFGFDPAIRKIIYTTNAIESLNRVIRKSIKTRGSFPTDEAATKLIYLAIRKFEKDGRNVREWFAARNQFAIMFGERFDARQPATPHRPASSRLIAIATLCPPVLRTGPSACTSTPNGWLSLPKGRSSVSTGASLKGRTGNRAASSMTGAITSPWSSASRARFAMAPRLSKCRRAFVSCRIRCCAGPAAIGRWSTSCHWCCITTNRPCFARWTWH